MPMYDYLNNRYWFKNRLIGNLSSLSLTELLMEGSERTKQFITCRFTQGLKSLKFPSRGSSEPSSVIWGKCAWWSWTVYEVKQIRAMVCVVWWCWSSRVSNTPSDEDLLDSCFHTHSLPPLSCMWIKCMEHSLFKFTRWVAFLVHNLLSALCTSSVCSFRWKYHSFWQ